MNKYLKISLGTLGAVLLVYLLGPKVKTPEYKTDLPIVPKSAEGLEEYIKTMDSSLHIKPGNEAKIVWYNDSLKNKTSIALLYLHGFSASHEEGNPVHIEFAKRYGANLYLSRLFDHGIDTPNALINLTAENYWKSAKKAYAIAGQLGDQVIIMGTSTGGTLALKLAATYPEIMALFLLSPNIAINNPNAWIANNHWGLQIARLVVGEDYVETPETDTNIIKYWDKKYRLEAVSNLQELLETSMNVDTFQKIHCPVLTLYYYKNEQEQDPVIKVSAVLKMFNELGTPEGLKQAESIPNAGAHVIGSKWKSKDVPSVQRACYTFAEHTLHLTPIVFNSN